MPQDLLDSASQQMNDRTLSRVASSFNGIAGEYQQMGTGASVNKLNQAFSASLDLLGCLQREASKYNAILKQMQTAPRFARGGEIRGGSRTGDHNWAKVNAGEWVLTERQMDTLKRRLGVQRRDDVFKMAGGNPSVRHYDGNGVRKFAKGGRVEPSIDAIRNSMAELEDELKRVADKVRGMNGKSKRMASIAMENLSSIFDGLNETLGSSELSDMGNSLPRELGKIVQKIRKRKKPAQLNFLQGISDDLSNLQIGVEGNRTARLTRNEFDKRDFLYRKIRQTSNGARLGAFLDDNNNLRTGLSRSQMTEAAEAKLRVMSDVKKDQTGKFTRDEKGYAEKQVDVLKDLIRLLKDKTQRPSKGRMESIFGDIMGGTLEQGEKAASEIDTESFEHSLSFVESLLGKIGDSAKDVQEDIENMAGKGAGKSMLLAAAFVYATEKLMDFIDGVRSAVDEAANLTKTYEQSKGSFDAAFGKGGLSNFREQFSLLREDMKELAPMMTDAFRESGIQMEQMREVAGNIKDIFGTMDAGVFRDALEVMKELTEGDMKALMRKGGTAEDRSNLYANLLASGNSAKALEMLNKGVFNQEESTLELSEGDRRLLEALKKSNEIEEGMNQSLKDIFGNVSSSFPAATYFRKFLSVASGVGATYLTAQAILGLLVKKEAKDDGKSLLDFIKGGKSWLGGKVGGSSVGRAFGNIGQSLKDSAIGRGVASKIGSMGGIGGAAMSTLLPIAGLAATSYLTKKAYDVNAADYQSFVSKRRKTMEDAGYVSQIGRKDEWEHAYNNSTSTWRSKVMMRLAQSLNDDIRNNVMTRGIVSGGVYKGGIHTGNKMVDLMRRVADRLNILIGLDDKSLRASLEDNAKTETMIKLIKSGKYTRAYDMRAEFYTRSNDISMRHGGNAGAFVGNMSGIMDASAQSFVKNSELVSKRFAEMVKNDKMSEEAKLEAGRAIINQQLELNEKYIEAMERNIDSMKQIPSIILHEMIRNLNASMNELKGKTGTGSTGEYISQRMQELQNAADDMDKTAKAMAENLKAVNEMEDKMKAQAEQSQKRLGSLRTFGADYINEDGTIDQARLESRKENNKKARAKILEGKGIVDADALISIREQSMRSYQENQERLKAFYGANENGELKNVGLNEQQKKEEMAKLREAYDKQISYLGEQMLNVSDEGTRKDIEAAIEKLKQEKEKLEVTFKKGMTTESLQNEYKGIQSSMGVASAGKEVFIKTLESGSQQDIEKYFGKDSDTTRKILALRAERGQFTEAELENFRLQYAQGAPERAQKQRVAIAQDVADKLSRQSEQIEALFDETKNPAVIYANRVKNMLDESQEAMEFAGQGVENFSRATQAQLDKITAMEEQLKKSKKIAEEMSEQFAEQYNSAMSDLTKKGIDTSQFEDYINAQSTLAELREKQVNGEDVADQIKRWEEEVTRLSAGLDQSTRDLADGLSGMKNGIRLATLSAKEAESGIGKETQQFLNGLEENIKRSMDTSKKRLAQSMLDMSDAFGELGTMDLDADKVGKAVRAGIQGAVSEYQNTMETADRQLSEGLKKLDDKIKNETDAKKRQSLIDERQVLINRDTEKRAKAEAAMKKRVAESAKLEFERKQAVVDLQSRGLDIQSDLLETIGGPVEKIVEIEAQRVGLAQQELAAATQYVKEMEELYAEGKVSEKDIREARLTQAQKEAEVLKKQYGAQNSMLEKVFGNMIGAFGEVAGIMGPNNNAAKFGMGYVQLADGTVAMGGGYKGGYRERLFAANAAGALDNKVEGGTKGQEDTQKERTDLKETFTDEKEATEAVADWTKKIFNLLTQWVDSQNPNKISAGALPAKAEGGKIVAPYKTGDRNLIRVNADEWVLNERQMNRLASGFGFGSPEEVFRFAGGSLNGVYDEFEVPMAAGGRKAAYKASQEYSKRKTLANQKAQKNYELVYSPKHEFDNEMKGNYSGYLAHLEEQYRLADELAYQDSAGTLKSPASSSAVERRQRAAKAESPMQAQGLRITSPVQQGTIQSGLGDSLTKPGAMSSHANGTSAGSGRTEALSYNGELRVKVTFDFDSGKFKADLEKYVVSLNNPAHVPNR